MTFIQALGGVLLLGSFVGAVLLLIWQQWRIVRHISRDDYELSMWERRR